MSGPVIYTDGVHLVADDGDRAAATRFARKIGLSMRDRDDQHYVLPTRAKVLEAIEAGAVLISAEDWAKVAHRAMRRRNGDFNNVVKAILGIDDDWRPEPIQLGGDRP